MSWHLAKYEPAPFLPPWLYLSLAIGAILVWFFYYLLKSKVRLDFKPFDSDGLRFEPLKFETSNQIDTFRVMLDSLPDMTVKFLKMNSKRFSACGMIVKSEESVSMIPFFPVRFVPYKDSSFDIEWLPRFAFSVPESSQLALIVDNTLFAEEHRNKQKPAQIMEALISIAWDMEIGKLVFWPSVDEALSSEKLEEMGYPVIKQQDKYYVDIDQVQNSTSLINKSQNNSGK